MLGRRLQKSLSKVRDVARSKSELEQHLREALSKESWGAPNSLLQEIALTTEEAEDRALILKHVWDILDNGSAYWRRILKVLTLIEVLLKRGSVKMIQEIQKDSWKIARYREHRVKEQGREVGQGIQEKARIILDMLANPEELNRERNKNFELYSKMSGVGNGEPEPREKKGGRRTRKDALQSEIDMQQERASQHIMMHEFMAETGASEQAASRFLHLSHGNMNRALEEFHRHQANARPSPGTIREMCQQVMAITTIPESRALKLLEQCRFDVGDAIDKALSSGGNSLQERSTTASSDSGSDSSGSENDDDYRHGPRGNRQGRPTSGPGFGAMPRDTGAFGPTSFGGWSPRDNGTFGQHDQYTSGKGQNFSPRANGTFGQHDQYTSGKGQNFSPRANGTFGQHDQYTSGNGQNFSPRANGTFGQHDQYTNGKGQNFSPRANGSFGQHDQYTNGKGQNFSPRANGTFGQHDQYTSGKGQNTWPMQSGNPFGGQGVQPGNPFGGKGYGQGGPNQSFNAQPGGFQGFKGAGHAQQMAGGKGGFPGNNPFGGSNNSIFAQQGGFGGYNNGFPGQKGGVNGQMAGFSTPQQQQSGGFNQGQGVGFGGKGGINNPFGNF